MILTIYYVEIKSGLLSLILCILLFCLVCCLKKILDKSDFVTVGFIYF